MMLNPRVAGYYGMGGLVVVLLTILGWPLTALLIWPALALMGVVVGYLGAGGAIYGKRNGRLPLATRILFAPTLLGQSLSLRYYRRSCTPWDEALPNLLMGRLLTDSEAGELIDRGVTAVLDLTAEFSEPAALRALTYRNVRLLDLTAPTPHELRDAVEFVHDQLAAGGTVFVHCKVGYSRTATVIGAYLMVHGRYPSLGGVVEHLRTARPGIVIRPEAMRALALFHAATVQGEAPRG